MTEQQIKNAINLCKGEPLGKIMQLFNLGMWRAAQTKDMSDYFKCENTKEAVAFHLQRGF